MKVEELIIDGFKSYATRTVVSDWDPQFNAITGLNGSGKSNILDAICFVLGIASMATVRASNLQDLIYKRGQAGVTKASVTIVFDNLEKEKSPIGFENSPKISVTRQIILGGTSKYLVNGHKAQQQTVLNLFQSVQLNINNPNFLIMQGKITKVLNMKPQEVLALIEEAAGTRTFEDRKDKALKTMAKKEAKLQEIRSLLREEIEPKLEKLRSEKRVFLEFQKVQTDLEKLTRVIASHSYQLKSAQFHRYSTVRSEHEHIMGDLNSQLQRLASEVQNLAVDLDLVKKQKESELSEGGLIEVLQREETRLSDDITRMATSADLSSETAREEVAKVAALKLLLQTLQDQAANSADMFASLEAQYNESKQRYEAMKEEYNKKEELLSTLSTGVTAKGGADGGYMSHLKQCKDDLSNSQNFISKSRLKVAHLREKLKNDEARLALAKEDSKGLLAQVRAYKEEIAMKETKFLEQGFDFKTYNELRDQESMIRKQLDDYQYQLNGIKREVGNIDFQYSKPYPNFDSSSVKGIAMQLFSVCDKESDKAMALQVCAGGRLYNVVVDSADTASALLERGNLRRRVTIIPLDKIKVWSLPHNKVVYAKNKCPDKVELALNLINFEEELFKAMSYIFGSTFICADPNTAKEITFDPKIRARSITLDGDVYDPEGNLSGGSRKNNSSILLKMQQHNQLSQKISHLVKKHDQVCRELNRLDLLSQSTKSLQNELNLTKHELSLLERKMENSPATSIIKESEINTLEIEKLEELIRGEEENSAKLEEQITKISNDIKEFNQDKGSKLKELENELKGLRKQITKEDDLVKKSSDEYQNLQIEVDQQKIDIASFKESIESHEETLKDVNSKIDETSISLSEKIAELEGIRAKLEDEKAKMIGFNDEINELTSLITDKNEEMNQAKLSLQKLNHDLEKANGATSALRSQLDELIKENEWLTDESVVSGIIQQYPDVNLAECEAQAAVLGERFQNMKRKVNPNIMSMIENVEKKEAALMHMIRTIVKDKSKIENTIDKLNGYKRETLDATYKKVSEDFGNIFSDLLPGSFAKLVPVNFLDVTNGLEVKVKLGPVWKESLVELSGGQRSLIALSLIMALLQFKPAPMYILDEVDAALDLSHTQNIGHLIKTRFKGSQFIVVSLKEGMFTNANRVFRTRFQDGTSIVSSM
ncbi:RecF/RecN/SMC protein [Metschnikowia bicuspidata var. bicuspidata NRRL YB-4993]|uniref:Structural maintenance of chromosomes protein n=1 Tax=Metschnikowia bicuspidata var. bicuspidata NRRL YB-4993 TaxID=869754 RepID=A0A1A0HGN5_9ASCO|nr:RecF/RecN/SMC protein [Metschnikowia bicuspidata var. bicuspidata NRRL YB-4993]OBA23155.1 RecF/RecN/SMC protein [Metschnikowia bicuspidata var. bicuspidata NRRL YB-4993]